MNYLLNNLTHCMAKQTKKAFWGASLRHPSSFLTEEMVLHILSLALPPQHHFLLQILHAFIKKWGTTTIVLMGISFFKCWDEGKESREQRASTVYGFITISFTDSLSCFLMKAKNPHRVSIKKPSDLVSWWHSKEHIMWENKINIYPGKWKWIWVLTYLAGR